MKKIALLSALTLVACAAQTPQGSRTISSIEPGDFQSIKRDEKFDKVFPTVDLEAENFLLSWKDSGTSIGMKIKRKKEGDEKKDKKIGKWVPTNSATNPESQVVSWHVARYLQMSDQVVPGAYYTAGPKALEKFKDMIEAAGVSGRKIENNRDRKTNRANLLAAIQKNPNEMLGVLTAPIDNMDVPELVSVESNTLNKSHALAKFIRSDGPMPAADRNMALTSLLEKEDEAGKKRTVKFKFEDSELSFAKQLSRIMVLDILMGQWDRFSGGNLEADLIDEETHKAVLLARDNGGASMAGSSHLAKYFGLVTRFDKKQIDLVRKLEDELKRDPEAVKEAFHIRSGTKSLTNRVSSLVKHVDGLIANRGASQVYFAD